jgi:hypothetical protein
LAMTVLIVDPVSPLCGHCAQWRVGTVAGTTPQPEPRRKSTGFAETGRTCPCTSLGTWSHPLFKRFVVHADFQANFSLTFNCTLVLFSKQPNLSQQIMVDSKTVSVLVFLAHDINLPQFTTNVKAFFNKYFLSMKIIDIWYIGLILCGLICCCLD